MAGVGVMFYVLLALRAELRARGVFDAGQPAQARCAAALVALGTVADVVRLDANNRRLVAQGLKRIRAGPCRRAWRRCSRPPAASAGGAPPSTSALRWARASTPPGRLADMTLGIECLLTDDPARGDELAAHAGRHQPRAPRHRRRHARAGHADGRIAVDPTKATSRRRPSACSTPTFTKAWSASWPRASRTSCTAPPSCLPPAARRARARAQGLGPLDPRLSPARRAGPGGQAPPRRAAALWRPRHGGRLHHGRRAFRRCSSRPAQVAQRMAGRRHADAPHRHRRPAGARIPPRRPGGHAAPRGLGPGLCAARCSAKRWRC
jgi:hypothetical protein